MHKLRAFFFVFLFFAFPSVSFAQSPATMAEFWGNTAQFVFHSQFTTPTEELGPTAWNFMNANNSIVVKDGAWYLFNREYYSYRPPNCNTDTARITVRKSIDKGKTWTNKTRIIEPVPGSPNECMNTDGDAYYDRPTNTWHYIYQCLGRNTGGWALCHATRVGAEPLGVFTQNSRNPVVKDDAVWSQIMSGTQEEGTPEIIKKEGEYFYVTFHGINNNDANLYRGIARTRNFVDWDAYMDYPIFMPSDCQPWNIQWNTTGQKHGGCHGGGHATILQEGEYYYQFIEAPDMHYSILNNPQQNWTFGLVRTRNLTSSGWNRQWEQLPLGSIIVDVSNELLNGQRYPYTTGYQKFFRDTDGTIYMAIFRGNVVPGLDADPGTGHYIYRLERNAPFLDYELREGENHQWLWSSIVSRTPSYAQVWRTNWLRQTSPVRTYHLELNNPDAYILFPNITSQYLDRNGLDMQIDVNIRAKPAAGSAFIYGINPTFYLELYADGNLCGWIRGTNNQTTNACTSINSYLGQFHQYQLSYFNNTLSLKIDGKNMASATIAVAFASPGQPVRIGSSTQFAGGNIFQSFNGVVARARMGHHPLATYSYLPGDLNRNRAFDLGEKWTFFQQSDYKKQKTLA